MSMDLNELADRLASINEPDQGMDYSGGHSGERRYDTRTGEPYWTRGESARLTVYGDRARFLYRLIESGPEIAAALRTKALSGDA